MADKKNAAAPFIAFIPIGCALMVLGMGSERLFILAGIIFVVAGIVGIARARKADGEEAE